MYKIILYLMASLLCAGCSTAKVAEGTSSSVSHAFERGKYVYGTALAILSPAAIGGALVYDGITLGGLLSPSDTAKAVETATGYSSDPTTRAVGSIVGST